MSTSLAYNQIFTLNGSASMIGGITYRITEDTTNNVGAVWSVNHIDLLQPVDISFRANFGAKDALGGHGLAFVMQKSGQQVLGQDGNGFGYKGISPSVALCFDTYEDAIQGDPFFDHLTLHTNGIVNHGPTTPTVQASLGSFNIEDGLWHTVRVVWNPVGTSIQVYFDGILRLNASRDLINHVFGGTSLVWWGITASTGAASNLQQVQFHQPLPASVVTPLRMCAGDTMQVVAPMGSSYSWSPATGISSTTVRSPFLYPVSNTTYTLSYTDTLGNPVILTVPVNVFPLPTAFNLYSPAGDSTYCKGGIGIDIGLDGSQTTVKYDLLLNGVIYWPGVSGNGSGISFGYQQPSGYYTSIGTDYITRCSAPMLGRVTIVIDSLPLLFNLTGAGSYCQFGAGRLLGLEGSEPGVQYTLFRSGLNNITTVAGTGGAISFGYQQVAGNYTVRAENPLTGCTRWMTGTATVSILPLPTVTLSSFTSACVGAAPIALTGGNPAGGTYSGPGVMQDTLFNTALPGSIPITYAYTSPLSGCVNTAVSSLTLNALPMPSLGPDTAFCAGDSLVLQTSQAYTNYAWSQGSVSPAITIHAPGTYHITVTNQYTCQASDTIYVSMHALPNVHFTPPGPFCANAGPQNLTQGLPAGGTYTGPGVMAGMFYPSNIGPGVYALVYAYIDPLTSCLNRDTAMVTVYALPVLQHTALPAVCVSSPAFQLSGGLPAGGTYSGSGVSGGYFYPVTGAGPYNLTYTYTNPSTNCTESIPVPLTVHPLPVVQIPALPIVCEGNSAIALPVGIPAGGTYSGTGVSGSSFTPVNGAGPYLIRYHYMDPVSLCADSAAALLQVRPAPNVTFTGLALSYCGNAAPVTLIGNQAPFGTFTGHGITDLGNGAAIFDPAIALTYFAFLNKHEIRYTYTSPNGCTNYYSFFVTVHPVPTINAGPDQTICFGTIGQINAIPGSGTPPYIYIWNNTSTLSISSIRNPIATPSNTSSYTITITDANLCINTDSITIFVVPERTLDLGPDTFFCSETSILIEPYEVFSTYSWSQGSHLPYIEIVTAGLYSLTVTDIYGCTAVDSIIIEELILPNTYLILTHDTFCESDPPVALSGGIPLGGTYSGIGINNGFFYPNCGPGNYTVEYSYIDTISGCVGKAEDSFLVHPLPSLSHQIIPIQNINDLPLYLTNGYPSGGWYTGSGVSGNYFNTSQVGIFTIFYHFRHSSTSCHDSISIQIRVIDYPLTNSAYLSCKVLLQGAYQTGLLMTNSLTTLGIAPLIQPYNIEPWNYLGNEIMQDLPSNMTDWVLVELRSSFNTIAARRAALLLSDGTVVDTNGSSYLKFQIPAGEYFVVINHRNHLSIMSLNKVTLPNIITYDFTDNLNFPVLSNCAIEVNTGLSAMICGDVNNDGSLKFSGFFNDRSPILQKIISETGGSSLTSTCYGYYHHDLNLDGQVKYSGIKNDPSMIIQNIVNITGSNAITGFVNGYVPPGLIIEPMPNWSCGDTLIDVRDGQEYPTIQIGTQCWMAKNMNVGAFVNGIIDQANNGMIEKYCYDDTSSSCAIYGGLYQWNEMMGYISIPGAQGICPAGWHIPTDTEFITLADYLGGPIIASGKMKATGVEYWTAPNTGASNISGFTALGGGYRNTTGIYNALKYGTGFWTSSAYSSSYGIYHGLYFNNTYVDQSYEFKEIGFSIRCLKDE